MLVLASIMPDAPDIVLCSKLCWHNPADPGKNSQLYTRVEGKQNSLLTAGPIKCFVKPPNSKLEKTAKKVFALLQLAHKCTAAISRKMT